MFKNSTLTFTLMVAALLMSATSAKAQFIQTAEVNFDDIPAGGIPLGGFFTSGGVDMSVVLGGFGGGIGVMIENPAPTFVTASFPHVATPNNVGIKFDLNTVPDDTYMITFDYLNRGGDVTMEANGLLMGPIPDYPAAAAIGGTNVVSNSMTLANGDIRGSVRVESAAGIMDFMVGGQETQFDNFRFFTVGLLGDVNCDGEVNLLDVDPFIDLLTTGGYNPKADFNGDGQVNLLDVQPFVDALSG